EDSTDITVRLKQDVIKPEDDIVLFAVTITMRSVLENFKEYSIRAVIDNDSSLEGEEIEGIPIHTPEYLKSLRKSVKIIVTSRRYRQICEQLQAMGYRTGEQVFIAHASVLNEKPLSVIEETLDGRIVRGEEIYYDLRKHYGSIPVYIDPHTGTGDVYFSWLYLDKNEEFILIVPTESCRKLAEHLGIKSVLMSGEDISALAAYGRAKGLSDIGMKILNYSFDQYVTGRIRGYKGLDYNMMLQRTVFGAKERAVPIRIPQRDSDCLFAEYGIRKGHTVLLSPYAGHAEDIPMLFWRKLAEWLKREGYCVCTNISGEEKSIEGTKGLSLDYSEVIDFVDKAGVFIGLRSGLCDIIAPTSARMAVIYPNQMFTRSVDYYNYFSLEKMGLREENLLEMIWSRGDENYYMEKIASFLC
ncbi:MAG: hypothetical protein IJM62_06850, partial [Lachnospiraceae bacterium]|nr:hypothetical protein [Lachnospiraceae bacterium]